MSSFSRQELCLILRAVNALEESVSKHDADLGPLGRLQVKLYRLGAASVPEPATEPTTEPIRLFLVHKLRHEYPRLTRYLVALEQGGPLQVYKVRVNESKIEGKILYVTNGEVGLEAVLSMPLRCHLYKLVTLVHQGEQVDLPVVLSDEQETKTREPS